MSLLGAKSFGPGGQPVAATTGFDGGSVTGISIDPTQGANPILTEPNPPKKPNESGGSSVPLGDLSPDSLGEPDGPGDSRNNTGIIPPDITQPEPVDRSGQNDRERNSGTSIVTTRRDRPDAGESQHGFPGITPTNEPVMPSGSVPSRNVELPSPAEIAETRRRLVQSTAEARRRLQSTAEARAETTRARVQEVEAGLSEKDADPTGIGKMTKAAESGMQPAGSVTLEAGPFETIGIVLVGILALYFLR